MKNIKNIDFENKINEMNTLSLEISILSDVLYHYLNEEPENVDLNITFTKVINERALILKNKIRALCETLNI